MINIDVQNSLEGQLLDGEAMIWAEKTNHYTQEEHKKRFRLSHRQTLALKSICVLGFVGLIMMFSFTQRTNLLGSSMQKVLYYVLFQLSLLAFIIPTVLLLFNFMVRGRIYNVGAYGLTNKRLFELDYDMNVIRHLDASRVRHVYGMEGVTIKPIGARGNRSYQLGLMENNVLTINFLHRQIKQARQQESSASTAKPLAPTTPKL